MSAEPADSQSMHQDESRDTSENASPAEIIAERSASTDNPEIPDTRSRFVIMSGYHDYRSKRKADLHFIADELKKRGEVLFFSLRYSRLTRFKEDPRHDLWDRANRMELVNGIHCYLWRTPVHPCRLPPRFSLIEKAVFALFAAYLPKPAREALKKADIVFVESGMSVIYAPLIKRLEPRIEIIYMAADSLGAIRQAQTIKDAFRRHAHLFDGARIPSPYLRDEVPADIPCFYIPHGIDKTQFANIGPSPYKPGTLNAVSVGSMLFDPTFFEIAGPMFPEVTFHVIGSGYAEKSMENVIYYPEMKFYNTLPYLKHSTFAIAAYHAGVQPYLAHTSMKLMQYEFLLLPSVCPKSIGAGNRGRFEYTIGDPQSIRKAIMQAMSCLSIPRRDLLDWSGVTSRLLSPQHYTDTKLE